MICTQCGGEMDLYDCESCDGSGVDADGEWCEVCEGTRCVYRCNTCDFPELDDDEDWEE